MQTKNSNTKMVSTKMDAANTNSPVAASPVAAPVGALRPLRIAVLNKSGNVGKTTLVSCMIAPRLPELVRVAYVEMTNVMPDQIPEPIGEVFGAHEFGEVENELLDAKLKNKSMIIDFGASDYNTTIEMFSQFALFKKAVDMFVIPCAPKGKIQEDTTDVIDDLLDFGIDIKKIHVLFNNVPLRDKRNLRRTFRHVFDDQAKKKTKYNGNTFTANEQLVMYQAEIFNSLENLIPRISLADLLADKTDYESAAANSQDEDEQFYFARLDSVRALAKNTSGSFDKVFNELVKGFHNA